MFKEKKAKTKLFKEKRPKQTCLRKEAKNKTCSKKKGQNKLVLKGQIKPKVNHDKLFLGENYEEKKRPKQTGFKTKMK